MRQLDLKGWSARRLSEKCELCRSVHPSRKIIDKVADFEDVKAKTRSGGRGNACFALTDFVAICDCYKKKEDKGRVHYACLLNAVNNLDPETAEGRRGLTCEMCQKSYRIKIEESFSFSKLTSRSLAKFLRVLVYATMLACLVFCISTLRSEYQHDKVAVLLIIAFGIACFVLAAFSIYTMIRKFVSSSSSLRVSTLV